jgi:hypothetical protein
MDIQTGPQSSNPVPTRNDLDRLQLAQWLQHPVTRLFLNQLRSLHLRQLKQASKLTLNASPNIDPLLRLQLTKAATLETLIERIEKGELDETSQLL